MLVGDRKLWVRNLEPIFQKPFSIWPIAGSKSEGYIHWDVESATKRGARYRVSWNTGQFGEFIVCTCPAAVHGLRCKHAAYALLSIHRREMNRYLRERPALAAAKVHRHRRGLGWKDRSRLLADDDRGVVPVATSR